MNEETFLSALHESPNDEVTWLALADWLEEDGQKERAELVRVVRRLRTFPVMKRAKEKTALEDRVAQLLNAGVRPVVGERVNDLGMRFALIPPGRFRMGSPSGEKERGYDEKAHEVEITKAFYLGVFPVTQAQYQRVMRNNPSHFSRNGDGKPDVKKISDDELSNFPVEQASWQSAQGFLKNLNARAESKTNRWKYRLPSEAEWEYGCRGGWSSSTPFHFGASLSSKQANFDGTNPYGDAEKGGNLNRPCQVGSYRANAFGLYDMHGNVWELCQDWYSMDYQGASEDFTGSDRVVRGGCWGNTSGRCRSAKRDRVAPGERNLSVGFRVVLVLSG